MEAINFVYWLQGALELGNQKTMTEEQVKVIQDHLNLVLKKVTPQYQIQTPVSRTPYLGVGAIPNPQTPPVFSC